MAKDQFGNIVTSYNPGSTTVQFTSSDPLAILPTTVTWTKGVATFSATFETVGPETITADDSVNSVSGTSNNITVAPQTTGGKHS